MKRISFFAVATLAVVLMGCSSKSANTPTFDTTKLWPALDGKKWGFIDAAGNFKISADYAQVNGFSCGYASVLSKEGGDWAFVDNSGKEYQVDGQNGPATFYYNYAVYSDKNDKYSIVDKNFKVLVSDFYYISNVGEFDLFVGKEASKDEFQYFSLEGKVKIDKKFASAEPFLGGVAVVEKEGSYGLIDNSGNPVIKINKKALCNIGSGVVLVKEEDADEWTLTDHNGEKLCRGILSYKFVDNDLIAITKDRDSWSFITTKGQSTSIGSFAEVEAFYEGYAWVKKDREDGIWTLIDVNGNKKLSLKKEQTPITGVHNGLVLIKADTDDAQKYIYKNLNDEEVYSWKANGDESQIQFDGELNSYDMRRMTLNFDSRLLK